MIPFYVNWVMEVKILRMNKINHLDQKQVILILFKMIINLKHQGKLVKLIEWEQVLWIINLKQG